jgi:NTE family protein
MARRASRRADAAPRIDLALQGGGSHGAFTWGVLDRLLDAEDVTLDGICGTSAGALNAAVLATGYAQGGRKAGQQALRDFWLDVSGGHGCFGSVPPWPNPFGLAGFNLEMNPFYNGFNQFLRAFSPDQFNPYDLNLLRDVTRRHVDPAAVQRGPLKVFVTATSVRSGQPRIFTGQALTLEALMASACLPQLFRAVVIDGESYWDGGYSGNPAIWPLVYETAALDVVLVKINPLLRPRTPGTAEEIADRVNEITFNAGLIGEMRAIEFVQRLIAEGRVDTGNYKNLRLHMIADEDGLAPLHPSSKLNTSRDFLLTLHGLGHAAADRWLAAHRADLGVRGTLDIRKNFLQSDG